MIDRPSLTNFGLAYVTAVVVLGALDAAWLGGVAKNFYRQEIGPLLNETPQLLPAAAFYLLYPLGLVYLVLNPFPDTLGEAALRAAVVGLLAYGAYDLTNLSTLRGWSWRLSMVDWAWGTFVTMLTGAAVYWVVHRWQ
jgi:uncharacterized membrane protein